MDLNFTVKGSSRNLILMHGWGGSASSLAELQDMLAIKGFKVYNLDLPGFGKSPLTKEVMNMDDYTQEIEKFIEENKIVEPVLVGHSFGGKIATKIAIEQSKLIKPFISGIVLIAASGVKPRNKGKKVVFKGISGFGKAMFSLPILKYFYKPLRKFFYYYIVREKDYYNAGEKLSKTFTKINSEFYDERLNEIKIPTLIIWGSEDRITPLWMGEKYAEQIVGSKLEVVQGERHILPRLKPDIVSKIIYNYLLY